MLPKPIPNQADSPMNTDDKQRLYLLGGTVFLTFVVLVSIYFIASFAVNQQSSAIAFICSAAVLILNAVLLTSVGNWSRLLLVGRILLWLGFLSLASGCILTLQHL